MFLFNFCKNAAIKFNRVFFRQMNHLCKIANKKCRIKNAAMKVNFVEFVGVCHLYNVINKWMCFSLFKL